MEMQITKERRDTTTLPNCEIRWVNQNLYSTDDDCIPNNIDNNLRIKLNVKIIYFQYLQYLFQLIIQKNFLKRGNKRTNLLKLVFILFIAFFPTMNYLWEENNLQSLYSDLKETLPNQPLVRARLIDGLSNHCGEKPLVFHFFGKAENYVELVTRLISKNLLGSEKNERLLVFNHTDHLQKRIYENIAYWEQPTH